MSSKWRFTQCCINMTFTLSSHAKTFCTTTIDYILFSAVVESAQLVLKLDTAHFIHVIWMSDRWPPCVRPWRSCLSTAQLYERCIELMFTLGKRVFYETCLVQPSFRYKVYMTFLYTAFTLHSHTNYNIIQNDILYIMWTRGMSGCNPFTLFRGYLYFKLLQ